MHSPAHGVEQLVPQRGAPSVRRPWLWQRRWVGGATGVLATLALAAVAMKAEAAGAAPQVPTLLAGASPTGTAFELEASLQAQRQATVAAQLGGNVMALAVKAGEAVKAGQLLVRIDERDTAAGLAKGEAGVAQAQAELHNARANAERQRSLRGQGFVSQAALDTAETQLQAAQAALNAAQAGRAQAALARGFAAVTAPFAGTVLATHVEAGDLAAPGRALVTLYAPGALRAVVQLPASRSAAARAATEVLVQLTSEDGTSRWVKPQRRSELPGADAVSQTVEWRLDLAAADTNGLRPGQSLRVRFAGAPAATHVPAAPSRLRLPTAAVLQRGELSAVYVAQGAGFQLRAVRLGAETGGQVDVLAGLKAGERVAANAVQAGLAAAVPAER